MCRRLAVIVLPALLCLGFASPAAASPDGVACSGTGAATTTVYLPNVTKTLGGPDGWVTPFIVQNVGAIDTRLEISFYRFSDGAGIACRIVDGLAPRASFADVPNNDPDLPDDAQFSVVIRSFGAPVATVVNEVRTDEAAAYDGVTAGSPTVYLPNITRRYFGFDTPFIVQDLGPSPATVTALFVSFDGSKRTSMSFGLTTGRSRALDPNYLDGLIDGTQYAVTITSDQPVAAVVNTVNLDVPMASSYLGLTSGASKLFAPYFVRTYPRVGSSPVVVMNVGAAPAQPKLRVVYRQNSAQFCFTCPPDEFVGPVLAPGATMVFDPRTLRLADAVEGGAIITGIVPNTATADPNARFAAVVLPTSDTLTMAYQARPPTTLDSIFVPNVVKGLGGASGWTTRMAVLTDASVELDSIYYRFADGSQVGTALVGGGGFGITPSGQPAGLAAMFAIDPWTYGFLDADTQYSLVMTPHCQHATDQQGRPFPQANIGVVAIEIADGADNAMIYEAATGLRTMLFNTQTGPCS